MRFPRTLPTAFALVFAWCSNAHAADGRIVSDPSQPAERARVVVPANDLDLARERDQRVLRTRVRRAARDVCQVSAGGGIAARYDRCYQETLQRAEPQIALLIGQFMSGASAGSAGGGGPADGFKAQMIPSYDRGVCHRCPAP